MLFCMLICFVMMILLALGSGLLVWTGIVKPNTLPFFEIIMSLGIPIHIIGQIVAYRNAILESQ